MKTTHSCWRLRSCDALLQYWRVERLILCKATRQQEQVIFQQKHQGRVTHDSFIAAYGLPGIVVLGAPERCT